MRKLNLVICDTDEAYLRSLDNCLMVHCSRRFHIDSFTSVEALVSFVHAAPRKPDLLLACESLPFLSLPVQMVGKTLLLTEERKNGSPEEIGALYKYQHINNLVSGMLQALAEDGNDVRLPAGNGLSRIISVCSSSGGSGKTSVAVSCSILCARRGFRTFYLNLEKVPSTGRYFAGRADRNLSHVIYYLREYKESKGSKGSKGSNGSLAMKLEGARCTDPAYGVHFLLPPESLMDLEEMGRDEIGILLEELKKSGQYDFLFVDLPAGPDIKNLAVLEASDCMVRVESFGVRLDGRGELFSKELRLQQERRGIEYDSKTVMVLNRHPREMGESFDREGMPASDCLLLDEYAGLHCEHTGWLTDGGSAFAAQMSRLLDRFVAGEPVGIGKQAGGDRAG